MRTTEISFKEVYQLPLHIDDLCPIYVYSANEVMTFNILTDDKDKVKEVLDALNGKSNKRYNNVEYADEHILVDGKPIFLIRGWGHLTGVGTLSLPCETAVKIQNDFCNWVVRKLKG